MIKVARIDRVSDHVVRVGFTDGTVGEYNFSGLVAEPGKMTEPLRDPRYFAEVRLERGAPTWPNGFDVAPGWLHREMTASGSLVLPGATSSAMAGEPVTHR